MKKLMYAALAAMVLLVPSIVMGQTNVEDRTKPWGNWVLDDPSFSGLTWTVDSTGATITDTSGVYKIDPLAHITTWVETGVSTDSVSFYLQVSASRNTDYVTVDSLVMTDSVLNVKKWLATGHVSQPINALYARWIAIKRSSAAAGEPVVTGRIVATHKFENGR